MKKFNLIDSMSLAFENPWDSDEANNAPIGDWYWALDANTGILYQYCNRPEDALLDPAKVVLNELT